MRVPCKRVWSRPLGAFFMRPTRSHEELTIIDMSNIDADEQQDDIVYPSALSFLAVMYRLRPIRIKSKSGNIE
jgi:hypothetical protein